MSTPTNFSAQEWLRYTRHIQLPQVGVSGQVKLKKAHVLVVGAGGLGCPVLLYLAAAGVGEITIVDHDSIDLTNLQRQVLYTEDDIGNSKAITAKEKLQALNHNLKINAINSPFVVDNAEKLVNAADITLDCTDNFAVRYLINDTCTYLKKPWIYGSIHQFSGQCALFIPGGACFRCIFPEFPEGVADCNSAGVIGALPGLIGTYQANEALKYLCDLPTPLANQLLLLDALNISQSKIQLTPNAGCINCGEKRSPDKLTEFYKTTCISTAHNPAEISAQEAKQKLEEESVELIDVRTQEERAAFNIGGTHLQLDNLEEIIPTLTKTKKYICYCQSGIRSLKACEHLNSNGFESYSIKGGLVGWIKSS